MNENLKAALLLGIPVAVGLCLFYAYQGYDVRIENALGVYVGVVVGGFILFSLTAPKKKASPSQ